MQDGLLGLQLVVADDDADGLPCLACAWLASTCLVLRFRHEYELGYCNALRPTWPSPGGKAENQNPLVDVMTGRAMPILHKYKYEG